MRIALPHWQGRIAPVFDVAGTLLCVDLEAGRETRRETKSLSGLPVQARVAELVALGADLLICGAISAALQRAIELTGIRVIAFVCGEVETVLLALQQGESGLYSFAMPGCQHRGMRRGCCAGEPLRGKGCGRRNRQQETACQQKLKTGEASQQDEDRNC